MDDFDLFDMVGLAFDPPDTKASQVKKKIEQKKEELGMELGRETQPPKRAIIQSQIDYLENVEAQILTSDKKKIVTENLKKLSEKKIKKAIESLKATVSVLVLSGTKTITSVGLKEYKNESRLSEEHVKSVFEDAGIIIIKIDPLKAYPKFPVNSDFVYSVLQSLRQTTDPNPSGYDTSKIDDLYSFAAYISKEPDCVAKYRAMSTKELFSIFDSNSRVYSQRPDELGKLCASLLSAGKMYVFDSDEHRESYEKYLIYRSDALTQLFAAIKNATKSTRTNSKFAEKCISLIGTYFPDRDEALAIYNKEAEVIYIPPDSKYTIKCPDCDELNEFETEAEAQKINACRKCNHKLFKVCPKCGHMTQRNKEVCPNDKCRYVFASAELFSQYYNMAEASLRNGDFDSARQYIFKAQTVAPGEKDRINQLSRKIDETEIIHKQPINKIRGLIAERKYQAAQKFLGEIIRNYPTLNVSTFEATIRTELGKADSLFSSAKDYPPSKKADVCVSVLLQCYDHAPSIAFLRSTPPISCNSIFLKPDSTSGTINVSWNRSQEQGVNYRLVRKAGANAPLSENDGTVLLDSTGATSYIDTGIKPGQVYSYSVFAERMHVYSAPVSKSCVLYSDVSNFNLNQINNIIRITWDSPENCIGSTIIRSCDGNKSTLVKAAYGSFEDKNIQYGKTYTYRIVANYSGGFQSVGLEKKITPFITIDSFTIQATKVNETVYKISWSIHIPNIDLRVRVNKRVYAEVKSDSKSTQITIPRNSLCTIDVLASSGGKWISSENTIELNSYSSLKIDKLNSKIEEQMLSGKNGIQYRMDLRIALVGDCSSNIVAFYYSIRNNNDKSHWASVSDIGKKSDIQRISSDMYKSQKAILYQDFVRDVSAFFVTVFTVYQVGNKEVISEPQKMKIDRPLTADLFWKVSYSMFDRSLKLNITLQGNRPIDSIPEIVLCSCDGNQFIESYDSGNAQILLQVPPVDLDIPQTSLKKTYSINTDISMKQLKSSRFFLFTKNTLESETFSLRWEQGFNGKI